MGNFLLKNKKLVILSDMEESLNEVQSIEEETSLNALD